MRLLAVVVALLVGSAAGAAQAPVLVAVDEGARVRPVARFDGTRWAVTCEVPARGGAAPVGKRPHVIVSRGVVVDSVRNVPAGGVEWRQLEPVVKRLFEARERQENVSASALGSVPLTVDAIVSTASTSPPQIYYFRASKTIPDGRGDVDADDDGEVDPKGDLRLDVTGWLRREGELTSLGTNAALSWEQVDDRPQAGSRRSELTPIGIVRMAGARIWVMQGRAGEATWYTLYDVDGGSGRADSGRRVQLLARTELRGC